MLNAAISGVDKVKTLAAQNSQLAKNNYFFNIFPFSDDLGKAAFSATSSQPNDYSDAEAAITRANLPVGLDTHFDTTFTTLRKSVGGASGSGASYNSPLKVVILITDGLQSDFYSDFQYFLSNYDGHMDTTPWASQASKAGWSTNGTTTGPNAQSWTGHSYLNEYAGPIPASVCQSMAANHIILGIVETPYVPLDQATINGQVTQLKQSPSISNYEFYPYESFIRPVIYPQGPNTSSTVSAALQSCVSNPNYYAVADTADPLGIQNAMQKVVQAVITSNA